jgi:aspartate/glutamate/aspartate-prephenate aminotransferase
MTGYRLGYLCGPKDAIVAAGTLQGQITSCASSIAQAAGVVALELPDATLAPLVDAMAAKRDLVFRRLAAMPHVGMPPAPPSGAFYLLPEVDYYFGKTTPRGARLTDSTDLCVALLAETGVALVPGDAFGAPKAVRISYAASVKDLETALDRTGAWLATLSL